MPLSQLQIKHISLLDLPQLMAIERQVFNPPASAAVMKDSLRAAHNQAWGLLDANKELIGFGILSTVLDEAELLTLAIAPKWQGRGYSKVLMKFLIQKASAAKAETLYLEVRASQRIAISLYQKLGFKQIGLRKNYYPLINSTQREDALLLSLGLNEAGRIENA